MVCKVDALLAKFTIFLRKPEKASFKFSAGELEGIACQKFRNLPVSPYGGLTVSKLFWRKRYVCHRFC